MASRRSWLVPFSLFANGVLITAILVAIASRFFSSAPKPPVSSGPTIEQVQELSELVVLRLQIADVLYNDGIPGAKMAVLVRGDCDLVVDLHRAKILERNSEKQIAKIQLPMPQATRPRVDHNRTRVYKVE